MEGCGSWLALPKKQKNLSLKGTLEVFLFRHLVANMDDLLVQGSGEHGIVGSLPVGLGQASGQVDVPDGAKIEAAAAFAGTLRSRPGKLDALGSVRSREGKVQCFLKEYDGHTRVFRCHDFHSIHDAMGCDGWDIRVTMHGNILDLSDTLSSVGVSDNDTIRVHCRLRGGSNNTDIPGDAVLASAAKLLQVWCASTGQSSNSCSLECWKE